jgi:hypothetical protein
MVQLFRHRQPKGADTAKPHLSPPRHIPTLPCVDGPRLARDFFAWWIGGLADSGQSLMSAQGPDYRC